MTSRLRRIAIGIDLSRWRAPVWLVLALAAGCSQKTVNVQEELESPAERALAYYESGVEWHDQEEQDKAIVAYGKAIELDPSQADFWFSRGVAWDDKGEYGKAVADYDQALRLNPQSADAYYNRGYARQALGEHHAAIADFDDCLRLDAQHADAWLNRGLSWDELGDVERAIQDYSQAINLDPQLSDAYNNRGLARESQGKYPQALADYEAAIQADAGNYRPHLNRAWLLGACPQDDLRDGPRAIASAKRALELMGENDPVALDVLATAHAEAGNFDAAVEHETQAVAGAPDELREEFTARLELYRAGKPFRLEP